MWMPTTDGGSYQHEQSAVRQSEYSGHLPYAVLNRMEQTGLYAQDQMGGINGDDGRPLRLRHDLNVNPRHQQRRRITTSSSAGAAASTTCSITASPYFSYSESFEPVSGSNSRGQPFDPSRGKQYEAGVKYVPKDMPVVVTAAVYQLTKDKNLTADPANRFSIQTGEIRSAALSWRRRRR